MGVGFTHRLLSSSFLGLPYRILNMNHKKGSTLPYKILNMNHKKVLLCLIGF